MTMVLWLSGIGVPLQKEILGLDSRLDLMKEKVFTLTATDFEIHTFSTSGAGGQRRDRKQTGVRIVHPPSGASASASDTRSQWQNKKLALKRLTEDPKFRYWCDLEVRGIESTKEWFEKNVTEDTVLVERRERNGNWSKDEPLTRKELKELTG